MEGSLRRPMGRRSRERLTSIGGARRAQDRRHRRPARHVIDLQRRKPTLVVMRVPECKLLAPMRRAERSGIRRTLTGRQYLTPLHDLVLMPKATKLGKTTSWLATSELALWR
jgi:hypothetical protein